jgi:endonuclease YncB( thermonuclease family)
MPNYLKKDNISPLVRKIQDEIEDGKARLQKAVDVQKTISYWNIGKHISKYISSHKEKAEYSGSIFSRLSKELNISQRTLYLSFQFFKNYPSVSEIVDHLTWGHYKILLTLKSEDDRQKYTKYLFKNRLSTREFFVLIKNEAGYNPAHKGKTLPALRGVPYVYKLKSINDRVFLDLGFKTYYDFSKGRKIKYDEGSLIQSVKSGGYSFVRSKYSDDVLYTYKAHVNKVINGDTLILDIDLGFGIFTSQKIRLNGVNALELYTESGKKARQYLNSKLNGLDFVVIKTYHIAKYSRFTADIYYSGKYDDIESVINKGNFLNQELIDNRLAERYYIH